MHVQWPRTEGSSSRHGDRNEGKNNKEKKRRPLPTAPSNPSHSLFLFLFSKLRSLFLFISRECVQQRRELRLLESREPASERARASREKKRGKRVCEDTERERRKKTLTFDPTFFLSSQKKTRSIVGDDAGDERKKSVSSVVKEEERKRERKDGRSFSSSSS